jgi:uncharacterized damage-inducible protein DinB
MARAGKRVRRDPPTSRESSGLDAAVIAPWRTNCRTTSFLVDHLPAPLWDLAVPGAPRRTVRMIAAHFHNSRARWIRTLGEEHGIRAPSLVNPRKIGRPALLAALNRSGRGIESILELGIERGGQVPPSKQYSWRNLPLDVGHVLTYFVAHEAHHRGQLIMLARAAGHRLPREVTDGIWQWQRLSREPRRAPRS